MPQLNDTEFHGSWEIVSTDMWDKGALDLIGTATLRFGRDDMGYLTMIAIQADIDYRLEELSGERLVQFSLQGDDDGHPICGRGWAKRDGAKLRGMIYLHRGDETDFEAVRTAGNRI